ncbi:hypothetical protein L2E82_11545 [Cichorium intybus]|uniref:Uncharacterized protein n=1 Tax=Cichorium intybus TaxID=13427 RepID=A0ACB9GEB3_CICIN|nr:hypothetical protein L2E82_11545 [Cichorium intybus]
MPAVARSAYLFTFTICYNGRKKIWCHPYFTFLVPPLGEIVVFFTRIGLPDFIQGDCAIVLELEQVMKLRYLEN